MKTCYCVTCDKALHPMGVAGHRAMHKRRKQNCTIQVTSGKTFTWRYGEKPTPPASDTANV